MSFIWRTGVTDTTPPGLSDTGLLIIRIVMTVVLGIGLLYGILIMTTFQRYGSVMDKIWKQRIDKWIKEKSTENKGPFPQAALDSLPYSPPRWSYPDRSAIYQPPTYDPTLHYRPYFAGVDGRYPQYTYAPVFAPHTYAPAPHTGLPRSSTPTNFDDASAIYRPGPNQLPINTLPNAFQDFGGMTSATYFPNPGATPPPLNPKGPVDTAGGFQFPTGFVPLTPILESPVTPSEDKDDALRFSSGSENRNSGGDHAPDDRNRVHFRLPSGSSDSSNHWQGFPRKTRTRKPPKR